MPELSYVLISSTLLFTFTYYYLLKTYLVEWSCRRFLRDRVKIAGDPHLRSGAKTSPEGPSEKIGRGSGDLTTVTKGDMAEIAELMVSQVIKSLTGLAGLLAIYETGHDSLYSKSPLLVTFVHIPAWYLFYDLFAMFDAFTLRKNLKHLSLVEQLSIFMRRKPGVIFHHTILFFCGYPLVLSYSVRRGMGDFVIALFLFMELTNPFLSMTMILKLLGLTRTKLYFVNGIILIVLWFFIRVLNFPIALLVYSAQYHSWHILSALKAMGAICHPFCALHFGFQTYWFYQIFKISLHTAFSKSQKTS